MALPNKYDLAVAFCRQLEHALTPEQMDQVNELNAAETNENICHSHDFTDANQVMLDACIVEGWDEYSPNTNAKHDSLVQQAWDIAKDCEFCDEDVQRRKHGN